MTRSKNTSPAKGRKRMHEDDEPSEAYKKLREEIMPHMVTCRDTELEFKRDFDKFENDRDIVKNKMATIVAAEAAIEQKRQEIQALQLQINANKAELAALQVEDEAALTQKQKVAQAKVNEATAALVMYMVTDDIAVNSESFISKSADFAAAVADCASELRTDEVEAAIALLFNK